MVNDGQPAPHQVLVVGYGNPLRGDDGVGQEVAEALWAARATSPDLNGATFVWSHQLTPEIALDVARSGFVVFVDAASDGQAAGSVTVRALAPWEDGPAGADAGVPGGCLPTSRLGAAAGGCWQDLSPEALVSLARDLYGSAPPAVLVTVSVGDLQLGSRLSPAVSAAVPKAVASVRDLVGARA